MQATEILYYQGEKNLEAAAATSAAAGVIFVPCIVRVSYKTQCIFDKS